MTTLAEQIFTRSLAKPWHAVALPVSSMAADFEAEELGSLPSGARILDVGIGTGIVAKKLMSKLDVKVDGVDASSDMLAVARKSLPEGTRLYRASATGLPVPARSYDAVLYNYVLRYMTPADTNDVLFEAARIMKPNGKVIIADLNFPRLRPFKQPLEESADPNVLGIWAAYSKEEFIEKAREFRLIHKRTRYPLLSFMMVFRKGEIAQ